MAHIPLASLKTNLDDYFRACAATTHGIADEERAALLALVTGSDLEWVDGPTAALGAPVVSGAILALVEHDALTVRDVVEAMARFSGTPFRSVDDVGVPAIVHLTNGESDQRVVRSALRAVVAAMHRLFADGCTTFEHVAKLCISALNELAKLVEADDRESVEVLIASVVDVIAVAKAHPVAWPVTASFLKNVAHFPGVPAATLGVGVLDLLVRMLDRHSAFQNTAAGDMCDEALDVWEFATDVATTHPEACFKALGVIAEVKDKTLRPTARPSQIAAFLRVASHRWTILV